MKSRFKT